MNPNKEICCDGCGALVTGDHLRLRVSRLEFATRFRPIHIDALILIPSPPARFEDYFYRPSKSSDDRGVESRGFFRAVLSAASIDASPCRDEKTLLEEFQRAGCFLADWSECPPESAHIVADGTLRNLLPSVVRRIRFSYRPKRIIPLSHRLSPHLSALRESSLGESLVLQGAEPLDFPDFSDSVAVARFQADLTALLVKGTPREKAAGRS
ncbi:MAG TPA: hypothetical protein VGR81_01125 [Candidatus Acidoferrales bacterium]|nr:hypothetical protein [Candidatus Acidoferrales bacterium]